jgi:hypothetical protein
MASRTRTIVGAVAVLGSAAVLLSQLGGGPVATTEAAPTGNPLDQIIQQRGLTPDEAEAALKVFVPPGKYDDFVMITSGGHRGTIMLYGIPSMRREGGYMGRRRVHPLARRAGATDAAAVGRDRRRTCTRREVLLHRLPRARRRPRR